MRALHRLGVWEGPALFLVANVCFAAMAVLARAASSGMGPAQLVVIRFAICAAGVLALWAANLTTLAIRRPTLLTLRGLFGGGAVLLYFVALERSADAGTAALLNNLSPLFTALFAWWWLKERPGARLAAGGALALVGVALVLWRPIGFRLGPGELAGLGSAVLSGMAVTTLRASRASDNASSILLVFSLAGIVLALPFAVPAWRAGDAATWGLAVAVGVVSFVAQLLMTHAFGLMPAARGAVFQQLVPVFTFGLGALLLGEAVTARTLSGAFLAVAAVAWASLPGR